MSLASLSESFEPMQVDAEENGGDDVEGGAGNAAEMRLLVDVMGGGGLGGLAAAALPAAASDDHRAVNFSVENPTLDLDTYAASYSNLGRLLRLQFVARHCPVLRVEALKLAIQHCSNTHNVALYGDLQKSLIAITGSTAEPAQSSSSSASKNNLPDVASASGPPAPPAQGAGGAGAAGEGGGAGARTQTATTVTGLPAPVIEWMEGRAKKGALKLEKLDTDLKNYRSNAIKESIRRGHDDLGDHYLDCGDLSNALKCYSRARDYCTTGRHVINMCVNVIRVSVYLQNWSHVTSYVNKASATPGCDDGAGRPGGAGTSSGSGNAEHQTMMMRLNCCAGLADMANRQYKAAAKKFIQANLDHCDLTDIMSTQNIATYGGLCALATLDRAELFKQVITSSSFKLFLELDPQLREVIANFHGSKYGKCLSLLDEIRDNLMLDMYLAPHVSTLYGMIRNRSLVQYFSPYLSADLKLMASSFNTTVTDLENELMTLILDGQIQARIDSHNKVLFSQDVDQRNVTFERSLEMASAYQRRARMLILRSAILKADVTIKPQAGGVGGHAAGGSGGHHSRGATAGGMAHQEAFLLSGTPAELIAFNNIPFGNEMA